MANEKKGVLFTAAILVFFVYFLAAAQPVPRETVLVNVWLRDLESQGETDDSGEQAAEYLIPYSQGNRFGYAASGGNLILNKVKNDYISISEDYWAEYPPAPEEITIKKPLGGGEIKIQNVKGYPFFLNGRIFIIGRDQSSLTELDEEGQIIWNYDFEAPLTSMDAADGFVLAGTLDGMVELLDGNGAPVFPSYAPAARIPVIAGCRLSSDGSKIALIAGIDQQRFIFLERYGTSDYRVTYHEFLKGEPFRREVHIAFINNDAKVVFEQARGLGIYDVKTRTRSDLPLNGTIEAMDSSGAEGLFFFIIREGSGQNRKRLISLKFAEDTENMVLVSAPFKSENVFLARHGNDVFIGGGMTLSAFHLDKM